MRKAEILGNKRDNSWSEDFEYAEGMEIVMLPRGEGRT